MQITHKFLTLFYTILLSNQPFLGSVFSDNVIFVGRILIAMLIILEYKEN